MLAIVKYWLVLRKHTFQAAKAFVLAANMVRFAARNVCFQIVKQCILKNGSYVSKLFCQMNDR